MSSSQIANAAAIRADGYSARVYASFCVYDVVASGTLTSGPVYPSGGISPFIATTYVTGAYTDVVRGMQVTFHDPVTGQEKGRTHIRNGGVINSGTFPIPEFSQAKLNLQTGDVFKVWNDFRLIARIVAATASFDPEQQFHTDEGSNPRPVLLSSGDWAGRVDDGEAFARVAFDLTDSYTTDPDSGGTINFLTHTQTGVALASGYADTDDALVLEVDASATAYTIVQEGEDDDNSKVGYRYSTVMVHDDDHPPHEVLLTAYEGTPENGFSFTIDVISGATDLDTIPEGCKVILWTGERVNGAWASYRNTAPGREHIIGVGYIRRETLSNDQEGVSSTVFQVESSLSVLKQLTSYSKVMEQSATPDSWSKVKTLGVLRADKQLKMFYSNLFDVNDVYYDAGLYNPRYPAFYLQRSNFYDQSKELLEGVDAITSCDRTGRLEVYTFQPYIPEADRAAVTVQWTFDADDVLDWEINSIHYDPVEQMKTSGFTGGASGNVPLFSLYPGDAPGTGIDTPSRDRLIVVDQDDLNERTGRYGAFVDDVFQNADGVKWRAFELKLTLRGSYNFLDFGKHFYSFTESLRGLTRIADLTEFLFYLTAVSWTPGEQGEGETQATFRVATNAAPGETFVPQPEDSIPWSSLPTYPPITLPDLFPGLLGRGIQRLATINVNGVSLTSTFHYPSPVWGALVKPWDGTLLLWLPNGFDPGRGWIISSTEIGYLTLSTGSYTSKHTFAVASVYRSADASFSESGFMAVVSYDGTQGTTCVYTTDNSTFNQVVINSNTAAFGDVVYCGCNISSKTTGRIVAGAATGLNTSAAYVSNSHGASWSTASPAFTNSVWGYGTIAIPWLNNGSDNSYYFARAKTYSYSTDQHGLFRRVAGVDTDISPVVGGENQAPVDVVRDGIAVSVLNSDRLLTVGRAGGSLSYGVFLTNNARSIPTWITVDALGGNFRRCALAGDDPNTGWVWGVSGAISQVTINGSITTLTSRTGNLAALTPGETIAIAGW